MGFPFVNAPFEKWVQDELTRRSKDRIGANQTTPFIWLTSSAIVSSGKGVTSIEGAKQSAKYKGCVISDKITAARRYSGFDSILGNDLDGKLIKVGSAPGQETGLKISPPIINSMEIDTDGENNTLKTATIDITIFSLKQLEMFELFFLKQTMIVVLEYGNNVNISPENTISRQIGAPFGIKVTDYNTQIAKESFIKVSDYDAYINKIKKYYSPEVLEYRKTRADYLKILERTGGNYDFWVAIVTNFNVTYNSDDDTYKVSLTISSGNELQMWMPLKQQSAVKTGIPGSRTQSTTKKNDASTWMLKLCSELKLPADLTEKFVNEAIGKYKDEFFNYGKTADKNDKDSANNDEYISFKLILDILNNVELVKSVDKKINYELIEVLGKPVIPVNSDKNIISTTSDFIFPGKIPKLIPDPKNPGKILFSDKPYEFTINGKSFNFASDAPSFKYKNSQPIDPILKTSGTIGNLLNVFVKAKTFERFFKESYTYSDFFNSMFDALTDALFGLCKLEISAVESEGRAALTIVDKKLYQPKTTDIVKKFYRFSNKPEDGIMHQMEFNIEMSNLKQAEALYNSQLYAYEKNKSTSDTKVESKQGAAFEEDRAVVQLLGQSNGDNLHSVDYASFTIQSLTDKYQLNKADDKTANESKPTDTEVANDPKSLQTAIDGDYIKFHNPKDNTIAPLIYEDFVFIQSQINGKPKKSSVLTYLECNVTIDGISGIKCGEMFNVSGVPELYNKKGAFQILNVKQSVQPDTGWRTTLNAGFRYNEE
jgi:hypothetical protein